MESADTQSTGRAHRTSRSRNTGCSRDSRSNSDTSSRHQGKTDLWASAKPLHDTCFIHTRVRPCRVKNSNEGRGLDPATPVAVAHAHRVAPQPRSTKAGARTPATRARLQRSRRECPPGAAGADRRAADGRWPGGLRVDGPGADARRDADRDDGTGTRTPGRPPLDPDTVSAAQKLIEAGLSPARTAKQLGIGRATAYRIAKAER